MTCLYVGTFDVSASLMKCGVVILSCSINYVVAMDIDFLYCCVVLCVSNNTSGRGEWVCYDVGTVPAVLSL